MLKSLYPDVHWDMISHVGFDLDGTLYDEAEFIFQVYQTIAADFANSSKQDPGAIYDFMCSRWLEMGSSYPKIFSETLQKFGGLDEEKALIKRALAEFRVFKPCLRLNARVKFLLDAFARDFTVFLVTDGREILQQYKIDALGVAPWFGQHIYITGAIGNGSYKPNTSVIDHIPLLSNINPSHVLYIGDRSIDRDFALNAGFQFLPVKEMNYNPAL